ncbi:MAG: SpoIIE family protein phosphatase [Phycisphaerae bacterium]|nr:SpoIIE family protein phosphatase [Phycisphaerae bacterium]
MTAASNPSMPDGPVAEAAELRHELALAHRAIEQAARRLGHLNDELELAGMLQRQFLPARLPRMGPFEFGALYRPASSVSGDVYDVVRIDRARAVFFLADVSGHGMPAAMLTLSITHFLDLRRYRRLEAGELRPSRLLSRLNGRIGRHRAAAPYLVSAVIGVLDATTATVTVASAGHPPPTMLRAGAGTQVHSGGPLLGVQPDAIFEDATLGLEPGDTLVMASDGIDPVPIHASGRLPEVLRPLAERPADRTAADALDSVAAALDAQAGSLHQTDDVTVLALTRHAAPGARRAA